MANRGYRPEREVTSEKIKLTIEKLFKGRHPKYKTAAGTWKRQWKRRLPQSKGLLRGYVGFGAGPGSGRHFFTALAVSSECDKELKYVYVMDEKASTLEEALKTLDDECKKMGVLEVIMSDDQKEVRPEERPEVQGEN